MLAQTNVRESVHPAHIRFERMRGYQHQVLLNKLQAELGITLTEAAVLFEDVKRFLALCVSTPQPLAPTKALDQGWHAFILFTNDYSSFCKQYCGHYVHHEPEDPLAPVKDYETVPRTRKLANIVFGDLSPNWSGPVASAEAVDCNPPSCQPKDCSPNDCKRIETSSADTLTCMGKGCMNNG